MANRWSHAHGKTSPEVVPFTWQPTNRLCSPPASMHDHDDDDYQHGNNQEEPRDIYPPCPPWFSLVLL